MTKRIENKGLWKQALFLRLFSEALYFGRLFASIESYVPYGASRPFWRGVFTGGGRVFIGVYIGLYMGGSISIYLYI